MSYDFRYDRSGESYRPEMGFELRKDYFRIGDRISYGWQHSPESILERQRGSIINEAIFRNADGSLQSLKIGPNWEFIRRGGGLLRLSIFHHVEDIRAAFPLSQDTEIGKGTYKFQQAAINLNMPARLPLRSGIAILTGGFYDGWINSLSFTPIWNASKHLRLSAFLQLNHLTFPDQNPVTSKLGRIRMEVMPNVRYSIQTFVQYNSASDALVGNLRFRYNPREGNDFYIVFNEQLNTARSFQTPQLPFTQNRTLLIKYSYAFDI